MIDQNDAFRIPPPEIAEWAKYRLNIADLTIKQHEVTKLILKGLRTKDIATAAGITEKTVKHHIAAIFVKFHVNSRAELFAEIFGMLGP